MSTFKRVTSTVSNSAWAIVIWVASVWLLRHGLTLWYEDFSTTKAFMDMLPTLKVTGSTSNAVAYIVQILPLYLGYVFIDSYDPNQGKTNWGYGAIAMAIILFDLFTDSYYKMGNNGWDVFLVALVESAVVYTIGTEFLIVISMGVLFNLTKPAFYQLIGIFKGVVHVVSDVLNGNGPKESKGGFVPTPPKPQSFPQNKPPVTGGQGNPQFRSESKLPNPPIDVTDIFKQ